MSRSRQPKALGWAADVGGRLVGWQVRRLTLESALGGRRGWDAGGMAERWYYCLKHKRAEKGRQCWFQDRMGPYPDQATAERALEIVKARNAQADAGDKSWRDDGE